MSGPPDEVVAHLRSWIGAWPPAGRGVHVHAAVARTRPGWDGEVRSLLGAVDDDGCAVVSVAPDIHQRVTALLHGAPVERLADDTVRRAVGRLVAGEGAVLGRGVLRWTTAVDDTHGDVGEWVPADDPRVPDWLRPFGGEVLVVWDDDGAYGAGVGVKRHDDTGHELSVGTEPALRGRGLARRLVATAARRQLQRVPVVTYLHDPANTASARVADAVGIPDRGWQVLGVFGGAAGAEG